MADEHDEEIYVLGEDGEIRELGELDETEKAKISPSRIVGKRKPRKRKPKPFNRHFFNLIVFTLLTTIILLFGVSFLLSRLMAPPDLSQCPVIHSWWEEVSPTIGSFLDTTELAVRVRRDELPEYILELQRLRRDFEEFEYPPCTWTVFQPLQWALRGVVFELERYIEENEDDPARYGYDIHFIEAVEALHTLGVTDLEIDNRLRNPLFLGIDTARAGQE